MKLRHQGVLLLGIALGCQLVFAAVLTTNLNNVNQAARREYVAKQIITSCQDIRVIVLTYIKNIAAQRFIVINEFPNMQKELSKRLEARVQILKELVKQDATATRLVGNYQRELSIVNELVLSATEGYRSDDGVFHFARFINDREFLEELSAAVSKATHSETEITRRYAPVVKELRPESLEEREKLLQAIVGGVLVNCALMMILAWLSARKVLERLSVLMINMEKFGQGSTTELQQLTGNDEFTEIDSVFRQVSAARDAAEETRRSLFAMVSHDLRSPLTSVGLLLDLVLEVNSAELSPSVLKNLTKSRREVQRLVRLASSFLDLEKIESGKLELQKDLVDANEVIQPSLNALRGVADSKNIKLQAIHTENIQISCDADRVIQVLVNLLSNAVRFSPTGGTITVCVCAVEKAYRFEVCDEGPGVSEQEQSSLFKRFSQLSQSESSKQSGSGLGLYICKMLVEAHGGSIGCLARDKGSCFWFEIPDDEGTGEGQVDKSASN